MGVQMLDRVVTVLSNGLKVQEVPPKTAHVFSQPPLLFKSLTNRWPLDSFEAFMKAPTAPTWAETYDQVFRAVDYWTVLKDAREKHVVATWTLATYFHRLFVTFPRLSFHGEKGTGKSKALGTISLLAFNGLYQINPTVATLFRLIDALRPTLCIDEVESFSGSHHTDMMSILNGGYLRGHTVPRSRQTSNGGWAVECFEVYSPIAFGGIKGLNDTLEDRAITITMVRSRDTRAINRPQPTESEEFAGVRSACYAAYLFRFKDVDPATFEPEPWLSGRRLELYGPLLTIAKLADKVAYEAIYSLAREDVMHRSDISEDGAELIACLSRYLTRLSERVVYPQDIAESM